MLIKTCNRNYTEITLRFTGKLLQTNFTLSFNARHIHIRKDVFFRFFFHVPNVKSYSENRRTFYFIKPVTVLHS